MRHTAPLLCLICLLCLGCGPRKSPPLVVKPSPKPAATPFPVTAELSDANTIFSDEKGNRLLELTGVRVALPPGAKDATLEGTRAVLYEKGKAVLTITAKNVRVATSAKKLIAEGNVSATTPEGRVLRTDTLTWVPGKNPTREFGQVEGAGNVSFLSGASFALYGSRFSADTLLQTLKILP